MALKNFLEKINQDTKSNEDSIYCGFTKKDVSKDECYKPKGCFHRDEQDRPMECQHLKIFVKQRNKELGIQHGL